MNLSRLVLEIFRVFEYHAQNLNTLQNNSASCDLQMGFNSAFKGLKVNHILRYFVSVTCFEYVDEIF